MKLKILFILFSLLILPAFTLAAELERVIEKSFDMSEAPRFSLENYKGKIKIRTHTQPTITVNARVYLAITDDRLSEEEKQQMLDATEVDFRHSDDRLQVSSNFEPKSFKRGIFGIGIFTPAYPTVDFDVVIPEDASITIDSYKGEFDVQAGSNYVQIESYKGTGIITGIKNDFDIDTYKGEFDIEITQLGDLDIETYKGRLNFTVDASDDFHLSASTYKGEIDISGSDLDKTSLGRRSNFDIKRGDGNQDIDINTYKGEITLRFE